MQPDRYTEIRLKQIDERKKSLTEELDRLNYQLEMIHQDIREWNYLAQLIVTYLKDKFPNPVYLYEITSMIKEKN